MLGSNAAANRLVQFSGQISIFRYRCFSKHNPGLGNFVLAWNEEKMNPLRTSALTALLLVLANTALAQDERMSLGLRTELQHSVKVRLSTDKATYDASENPMLTMEAANVGPRPVYMYPKARLGYDGDGVFRIYVKAEGQCLMHIWGEHEDQFLKTPTANLAEFIEKNWAVVKPGESIRLSQKLDTSRLSLCPGKNTLQINYFTKLQAWTPQQVRASEAELKYPAVYGSYDGNAVVITVRSDR